MNNKSLYRYIVLALCLTFVTLYSGNMISATKTKFEAMVSVGIFDGVSDTDFSLKEEMKRAQFAKVTALLTGLNVNLDLKKSSFSDVQSDSTNGGYALPYIEALKSGGITMAMVRYIQP